MGKPTKKTNAAIQRTDTEQKPPEEAPRSELIRLIGEAAYELGGIQEQLGLWQQRNQKSQEKVRALKLALDKRGKG